MTSDDNTTLIVMLSHFGIELQDRADADGRISLDQVRLAMGLAFRKISGDSPGEVLHIASAVVEFCSRLPQKRKREDGG